MRHFLSRHFPPTTHIRRPAREMHPCPFLRTPQLYECSPEVKGTPHHVVIGFNLGEDRNKPEVDVCASPLCDGERNSATSEQATSRSVLVSLLTGLKVQVDGLGGMVDEVEQVLSTSPFLPVKSKPLSITEKLEEVCAHENSVLKGVVVMKPDGFGGDDLHVHEDNREESIFSCVASPFSTCASLEFSGRDFLSVCFFCNSSLTHGKDLYMYNGDKAFCSAECRYQQIVVDEYKERQSSAASCFMRASNQSRKLFEGASTAVA